MFKEQYDLTKALKKEEQNKYNYILQNYISHKVSEKKNDKIILEVKYSYKEKGQELTADMFYYCVDDRNFTEIINKEKSNIFQGYYIKEFNYKGTDIKNDILKAFKLRNCFFDCEVSFDMFSFKGDDLKILNCFFLHSIKFNMVNFVKTSLNITRSFIYGKELLFSTVVFECQEKVQIYNNMFKECDLNLIKVNFKNTPFSIKNEGLEWKINKLKLNLFQCEINENSIIQMEELEHLQIKACHIEKDMNISYGAKKVSLQSSTILGNINVIEYIDIVSAVNCFYEEDSAYKNLAKSTKLKCKMEEFKMLSKIYNNLGQYENEDRAYVQYMNNLLDFQKEKETKKNERFKDNGYVFKRMTGYLGDYGTNPMKIIYNGIYIVVLFGLIYANIFCRSYCNSNIFDNIIDGLYFSGITFLTIGYGDINPNEFIGIYRSLMQLLTVMEGFLGVSIMSFFMVAIVRKVLR